MKHEIIVTSDGSHSLYLKDLDEHYHSIHGAIQESVHVFIKAGLHLVAPLHPAPIHVLEIGFGTGLNALLTAIETKKENWKVNYTSLEAFPLDLELIAKLNYIQCLNNEALSAFYQELHQCKWEEEVQVSDEMTLLKLKNTLQEVVLPSSFHLIYFDAFGPRVQPEMWVDEVFAKMFAALTPNGCLVTYCAKGEVKRALKRAGFEVQTLQGPPGKREMVRAIKHEKEI